MASSSQPSSSSSSSSSCLPTRGSTYDIFLSFRGEDTRYNFVDHLYAALVQKGIRAFKDDQMLGGGKPISQSLLNAIKESKFAVVVFSKNYANSSWCLEELSEIMECHDRTGLKVLPVFYHVDPSDVRKQKRDFAIVFDQQKGRCREEMEKVNKWRKALTAAANISGYHVSTHSGGESATINKIVLKILVDIQPRGRQKNLIGIESHMDKMNSLLSIEATDVVRIIGIYGMGGIGKTTIARALFRRISYKFEGSSFISNVRENGSSKRDICAFQEKILEDILGAHHEFRIQDPEYGADMIQERFCNKKVLLVLDDVDNVKQLEFLSGAHDWFGPGSRIIITTRDKHMLSDVKIVKYKPALLLKHQALELFSRHAFKENSPPDEMMELSNRAIRYTGGLPLALKVLGSFFHGREADVWESALNRLAETPNEEIFRTLKLSFDGLQEYEKKIFLDIACFYKGSEVDYVTRVLDSFSFHPVVGIKILIEKSLLTVSKNRIGMHDLIQEMGWQIVLEIHNIIMENKEPELIEAIAVDHRSLFFSNIEPELSEAIIWDPSLFFKKITPLLIDTMMRDLTGNGYYEDTLDQWLWWLLILILIWLILMKRELVQAIVNPWWWLHWKKRRLTKALGNWWKHNVFPKEGCCADVFRSMKNLRLLDVNKYFTCRKPTLLPHELRWLRWNNYPFSSLPLANMCKLVGLEMKFGNFKHLWKGQKIMLNLKYIQLEDLDYVSSIPDVSGALNIERLILSRCMNLVDVHESLALLKRLVYLKIHWCWKLKSFLSRIEMESLETLIMDKCFSLKRIPEFSPSMVKLYHISLCHCGRIEELPTSIRNVSNLRVLNLRRCMGLNKIPDSICELKCLKTLDITGCKKLKKLPDMCSLRELLINIGDEKFHPNHDGFSLKELDLRDSMIAQVHARISHLSYFRYLDSSWCKELQSLNGRLPSRFEESEHYQWLYKIRGRLF